jgi:hypothetical protein
VLTKLSAYHWNWIFIHCSLVLTFLNYSSVTSVVLLLITCLNWTIAASAHGETIVLVLVLVECGDEAIQCSELLNRLRLQREDSDPWHQIWLNPYINFFTKFWEGLQNMYNHAVISLSLLVITTQFWPSGRAYHTRFYTSGPYAWAKIHLLVNHI